MGNSRDNTGSSQATSGGSCVRRERVGVVRGNRGREDGAARLRGRVSNGVVSASAIHLHASRSSSLRAPKLTRS